MLTLGCHLSASKGYAAMVRQAMELNANTFAFFTRNPRGSSAKAENPEDAARALELLKANAFGPLVAHGAYTMNLCSAKEEARAFAAEVLADDLRRMAALPGNFYNFHPGSHVGQGAETGIAQIAAALRKALEPDYPVEVLLETMAGKGSEVGGRFEQLRAIIDCVQLQEHVGVCLDTCHVWDAGYDIAGDLEGVLAEFDRVIGLGRLHAVHLNNSLNPCGSHKDRHAKLRDGCIPPEALVRVTQHPALAGLPFILETPNDDAGYAQEISWLRAAQN